MYKFAINAINSLLDIPMAVRTERFSSLARARLSAVLQTARDLVTIDDAIKALAVDRQAAAKLLSRWQQQGWLKRVGSGIYAPIPLDASTTEQVLKDPWVLVPALFAPGYIGGWTAAEHWDLTEQLFRSIFVFTVRPFRNKQQTVQGVSFTLKRIPEDALFGIKTLWRGQARVSIADKHRTIVDLLADPATGGGIRHVWRCLLTYLRDPEADADTLIRYAEKLGNGAVFKRLGFLVSRIPGKESLAESCRQRLTEGNAKLDPALPCRRLVKAWRLWIPRNWDAEAERD
jgi:predicted transcriptional regulator of viral defense system